MCQFLEGLELIGNMTLLLKVFSAYIAELCLLENNKKKQNIIFSFFVSFQDFYSAFLSMRMSRDKV